MRFLYTLGEWNFMPILIADSNIMEVFMSRKSEVILLLMKDYF